MNTGKIESAVQSVLHVAGSAAVALAVIDPQWGALAQGVVGAAGALATALGAVWSFKTSRTL